MISSLLAMLQQQGLLLSDQEIDALSEAQSLLLDEDIADALWLASKLGGAHEVDQGEESEESEALGDSDEGGSIETIYDDTVPETPQPFVSAYIPPVVNLDSALLETPEQGLPIQVQAAPALPNPRDVGRSLRPLMRKVPSLTRAELNELDTVNRIAEQDIWLPILKPSPERWFDLELVIEANQFSFIWEETLDEFQHLLECQGAFRNVRTWYVKTSEAGQPTLVSKKQQSKEADINQPQRSHKELVDVSGRRLVLLVSDCRSQLWQQGQLHDWLTLWSQHGPAAIVQLLPERLWNQSELDVGFAVQVSSLIPGAPNHKLQVRELPVRTEIASVNRLVMPIVTLSAGALKQWAFVVGAAGRQRTPARLFDLSWVKAPERDRSIAVIQPKSPQERLELFLATSSLTAQRLVGMMAAVPVELSVVYLIQQELLRDVQPIHIAEVYTSGLLEAVKPDQSNSASPVQYEFVEGVRELLNQLTPIDETIEVLEALSQRIARTLGFEIKSFTALLSPKSDWSQETKDAILPFAQVATEVLHRLGGDYAELAELVEADAKGYSDWIQPSNPDFPDLKILEFTTAQLVEADPANVLPVLQSQEVEVVTIAFEPEVLESEPESLELFEFESAILERSTDPPQTGFSQNLFRRRSPREEPRVNWVIRRQRRQAYQWVEDLGNGVQLEMVAIPAGKFMMGSPKDELQRSNSEGPQHEVNVPAFLMGKYPVTQAQWKVVAAMPQIKRKLNPDPSNFKGDNRPVEQVSWYEAVEFCDRLSAHTGREYRLPSEAEWEYACRAGTTTPFHFGETITTDLANYRGVDEKIGSTIYSQGSYGEGPKGENRKQTTPVNRFNAANAFGLCDMHGNVWEWCQDHWHGNYEGATIDGSAWFSEDENARRVSRGGSWDGNPRNCRSAYRYFYNPNVRGYWLSFRVVSVAP